LPSRAVAVYLAAAHLAAIVAVLYCQIPVPAAVLAIVLIGLSWWYNQQLHAALKHRQSVRYLTQRDERWRLTLNDGRTVEAALQGWSWLTPLLVVLGFKVAGERLSRVVLLPRDSLPPAQHRRLRVLLKLYQRAAHGRR